MILVTSELPHRCALKSPFVMTQDDSGSSPRALCTSSHIALSPAACGELAAGRYSKVSKRLIHVLAISQPETRDSMILSLAVREDKHGL